MTSNHTDKHHVPCRFYLFTVAFSYISVVISSSVFALHDIEH